MPPQHQPVAPATQPSYLDPAAPLDTRVADLLSRMTRREKAGQLNQRMYGWDAYRRTPAGDFELTDALHAETERFAGLGALYGLMRADAWSGVDHGHGPGADDSADLADLVQRHVLDRSRLRIPALFVEEVPHGHMALDGTVLPVNLAVGATWDPDLYERAAAYAAAELRARGGHVALVSALDIARDPRWGRTEECFGEDPYLAARLTEALVRGMQGTPDADGDFAADRAPVVLKHFAGQGATVGGRNSAESELGPRELREIHLPAARAGVRAGAAAVMAAYNEVDGMPCSGNRALLTGLLRDGWGFRGLVMADGLAVDRLARITGDKVSAGALALDAGIDLSLWDEGFTHLEEAVERGLVGEAALDAAVARVLRLKFRLGLFENPYTRRTPIPEHTGRALSTDLARACVTLLRDPTGVLPIGASVRRVAVLGPHAATTAHQLGDYTAPQRPGTGASVLDALRRLAPPGTDVRHTKGAALTGADRTGIPAAVAEAAAADLAVLVLGGSSARTPGTGFDANGAARTVVSEMTCGEGVDLAGLRLGEAQDALLDAVVATGTPTAVVLVQGRPHVLPDTAGALLTAWYPGPWGGTAIAEVLLGLREPGGRLPVSVPRSAAQLPVHYNHKDTEYGAYVDESAEPLHSFGHGLSYTSFAYGTPRLAGSTVEVDVTNTGKRHGRTVVQVYLRRLITPVWPRTLELCAFEGVGLAPGERRTVSLSFDVPSDVGAVEIRVAESARGALAAVPAVLDVRA
ncbi:glycoside hydrolase family 3 N-terminal domain-containing protein [Streptomyces europaeiscabiei]|uniref:Glycoside hydrolase family 3 N-terminal domain-containing protein n=1 Tax=Streptomyces europaeiscabiei TaxID=146819 RepID=A0ABU4NMD5_9ACTN|nr:glycoside hydrolase family 3 N-terminal domain-containing protein [Streptomyces europaeiscabiei]MDX3546560.1 glycoside hydrolase family 3 N-terminal domain-containing protein [Streptomyces europaeiscabiei]MDX3556254.1 glycoside hydrolase family 3 N-terminal domain-containing protein [Streptomyces europaeiscabiei]MDX3703776.1 glycoside hydrolase family 3 N-terminal domain-containing protein [Streptomyces europaeiscabiei]MDX3846628.1 glycoside hydrolase family 3 N-terminal domain-containing pr